MCAAHFVSHRAAHQLAVRRLADGRTDVTCDAERSFLISCQEMETLFTPRQANVALQW